MYGLTREKLENLVKDVQFECKKSEKLTEVENFISELLIKNNCNNVFLSLDSTTDLVCQGNWFPIDKITDLRYDIIRKILRIDTDLEFCIVDLKADIMKNVDKETEYKDFDKFIEEHKEESKLASEMHHKRAITLRKNRIE